MGPAKIVETWNPPASSSEALIQYSPLLIGQLKALSAPYYYHLNNDYPEWLERQRYLNHTESGGIYPWTDQTLDDNNYGPAVIGQLKAVFALRFYEDQDLDGLPDLLEWRMVHASPLDQWFGLEDLDGASDFDGDGVSNLVEYQAGTDPLDPGSLGSTRLVGVWRFLEGSGFATADAGPSGSDGILMNGAAWGTGFNDLGGLALDGTNDYMMVDNPSHDPFNFGTGSFSISFWFNTTDTSAARMVNKGHYGWSRGFLTSVNGGSTPGVIGFGVGAGARANSTYIQTVKGFNDGRWHHFVGVADRQDNKLRIYIDGVAQRISRFSGTTGTVDPDETSLDISGAGGLNATYSASLTFGNAAHNNGNFYAHYEGDLDEVKIYDGALTQKAVSELYHHDEDRDGLLDYWEIKYGGDLAEDASGDYDGDGIANGDEQPIAPPSGVHQLVVVGDGQSTETESVAVTQPGPLTVVLPPGSPDYLAVVAIESQEYPEYTDESDWNDTVDWSVVVNSELALNGTDHVNNLHASFANGFSHFGYAPVHLAEIGIVKSNSESSATVELSATVTNIGDGEFPTTAIISLLPVELLTDIDNDGEIGGADSGLAQKAFESGATEEDIDKGTEFVFVNNELSNGLGDKEDVFAQGITEDDDAEAIKVTLDAEFGTVRFDHPAIDKFEFYESKECVNLLTFPMDLSVEDLPETIYLRTKDLSAGWNGQVEGDLVLKYKPSADAEEIDAAKIKLTVVESLGDDKFFHSCRDYMHENNSGKYIHDKGFPEHQPNPTTTIRMCCMLEETAFLQTIETSHKPVQHKGVRAVITANPHLDVLVNGNLVFFSNPDFNDWLSQLTGETHGEMTDLCNGRILEVGANSPASRDEAPVISGLNPNLAGPDGRYVAQHTDGKFTFSQGRVPLAGDINHAIGGLHTDYGSDDAKNWPIQMLGYGEAAEDGEGVVFTATGLTLAQGKGKGAEFKAAAEQSGVPPAAGAGRIKLFFLDFGKTSPALAHSNTSGVLTHIWSGDKHIGEAYYVNTYVGFIARKPRP